MDQLIITINQAATTFVSTTRVIDSIEQWLEDDATYCPNFATSGTYGSALSSSALSLEGAHSALVIELLVAMLDAQPHLNVVINRNNS